MRLLPEPRDINGNFGIEVPPERLAEIMLELEDQGALNINLVTATHYAHLLPGALAEARRQGLSIPIVYNTSGYERVEAVHELDGLVDIWLHGFQIRRRRTGTRALPCGRLPSIAAAALIEMAAQVRRRGGIAQRGGWHLDARDHRASSGAAWDMQTTRVACSTWYGTRWATYPSRS